MATTTRTKDRALATDKRGTSPSNSQTTHSQRCCSRHNNNTCTDRGRSSPAPATEKPMPNYLKPTISSRINEPVKLGNKKINNTHEDNHKLLRRRSFDKPPSASPRGQKALISPGPRDRGGSAPAPAVPRERKITVRSSSFGRNTVTTTKPVTPKAVRSPPVVSKPTKTKSTSFVNKKDTSSNYASSSSSRKSSSCRDTKQAMDHEAKPEEDLVEEVEEVVKVESETSEALSDVNVTKSEIDHDDQEDVRVVESNEDEKIYSCDISTCTSEDQNVIPEPHIDDQQVKADTQQEDDKEKISTEESHDGGLQEESVIEEEAKSLKESEDKGKEDDDHKNIVNESAEDDNKEVEEEVKLQHGQEALSQENKAKPKEGEDRLEGGCEEAINKQDDDKAAANVVVVPKVQEGQGKKESPSAAYNDVIEETASKLLEKRKNKVKALVGAFETVIDYESASSK